MYYYKVPQLCFYADVYYTVPAIKCKKVWLFTSLLSLG